MRSPERISGHFGNEEVIRAVQFDRGAALETVLIVLGAGMVSADDRCVQQLLDLESRLQTWRLRFAACLADCQVQSDHGGQNLVSLGIEVQAVFDEQIFSRLAIGPHRSVEGVDVVQVLAGGDVLLDQLVGLLLALDVGPAGWGGVDRHVGNPHLGQFCPHLLDKRPKVVANLLGCLAGVDVVAAGPQHDQPRLAGNDDAVGVVGAVGDLTAAETTVEDPVLGEIPGKRLPEADGGGTDEENSPRGWRIGAVGRLEGPDVQFPSLAAGLLCGKDVGRSQGCQT